MSEQVSDAGDINVRAVVWGGVAIAAGIVFAGAAAYFAYEQLRPESGYGGPDGEAGQFGVKVEQPLLQSAPQPERAAYFAEKEKLLNGYGWVDAKAGIARIPVTEAMRILAKEAQSGHGGKAGRTR